MILRGHLCTLRPWRIEDASSLVRHANNVHVARELRDRFPHPYRHGDAQMFLKLVSKADPCTNLAIEVQGEAAGGLGYVPGTDVERFSAEVGYWLGEQYWRRGVVSEALNLFTQYAFSELKLLRLFATPFADNRASIRVLEKAGYVLEGVMRSGCVKYGQPRDQALFAIVNAEFRMLK